MGYSKLVFPTVCSFPHFTRSMATDSYNSLKEELFQQREQMRNLHLRLEEEICSRKRLESIIRCNVLPNKQDIEWND